jgi:hypothetical protein
MTVGVGAVLETPVRQDQGSVEASHDNDLLLATPEMDGASFEALMKERTRVSGAAGGVWSGYGCSPLLYSHYNVYRFGKNVRSTVSQN